MQQLPARPYQLIIKASSWLALGVLVLTSCISLMIVLIQWRGDDRWEGIIDGAFALTPVLASLLSSLVVYLLLRFWLLRQRPASTYRRTFAGALLVGTAMLWLVPALTSADSSSYREYIGNPLGWAVGWANFKTSQTFWYLFWVSNAVGAGLGYVASSAQPARA
jgi:hypothetical protein